MSAQIIFETAPLGSLIRYRDGQPRPPERHRKKLAAWNGRNGVARFVKTEPARVRPTYTMPASITLREGDLTAGGVIMVVVMRTHLLTSELTFEVIERPAVGACQVLVEFEGAVELRPSRRRSRGGRSLAGQEPLCERPHRRDHRRYRGGGCRRGSGGLISLLRCNPLSPGHRAGRFISGDPP